MTERFQISIRRMIAAVALLGVSAALFAAYLPVRYQFPEGGALYFIACGFAGAGVGAIVKRPVVGLLVALIAGSIAAWLFHVILNDPRFPIHE